MLITLVVIGVIAALTIPNLIITSQKEQTVTKLKKAYSTLSQAIKLSDVDNSSMHDFAFSSSFQTPTTFNTYLAPYINYTKVETFSDDSEAREGIHVYLADGSMLEFSDNGVLPNDICIYTDPGKATVPGKNKFYFRWAKSSDPNDITIYIVPYDGGYMPTTPGYKGTAYSRDGWKTGAEGCNKTSTRKEFCAGLIMADSWRIQDDYPFFN